MSDGTIRRHDVDLVDLVDLVRLPNSRNGNPRYRIVTGFHGEFRTAPDAAISYELPNLFARGSDARRGVTLRIDGYGNVWDVVS